MKAWLILLLLLPFVVGFDYLVGEGKEVYFYCVNATDGRLLGTNANLTVRNETGEYYNVEALDNVDTGIFKHNITNLTRGHCFSFQLSCLDADTFKTQWGTVCTETNMTSSGYSNVASIGGTVFASGLFLYVSQYFFHIPMLAYSMIMLSEIFLTAAIYLGLKWAELSQAGVAVVGVLNYIFWGAVIIMALSLVAYFFYAVVLTFNKLFPKAKGGLV